MKRLTRKKVHIDEIGNRHNYEGNYVYIVEKLGRLEDLEEELGCRLEVVFEALKNGIHCMGNVNVNLEYIEGFGYVLVDTKRDYYFLKDYQKTWWLKGE